LVAYMCSLLFSVRTFTSNYHAYSDTNLNDPFILPYCPASHLNHVQLHLVTLLKRYYYFMNTWWLYLGVVY
ncbi:hypothetical protein BDF21DRAFT_432052, partial [Thamnidium elegans]